MTIENIAQVAHEINKAYCESIGDFSQPMWQEAPEWQRSSAINGVKFHIETPNASPSAAHEKWFAEREADGWKYGPVKDEAKKENPAFLPYDELPKEQKPKDFLFKQIVHSLKNYLDGIEEKYKY